MPTVATGLTTTDSPTSTTTTPFRQVLLLFVATGRDAATSLDPHQQTNDGSIGTSAADIEHASSTFGTYGFLTDPDTLDDRVDCRDHYQC
jgi:hypothetical protein